MLAWHIMTGVYISSIISTIFRMCSNNSIVAIFCFTFATSVLCKSVDFKNGSGSTNLIALGTVDGKTFFADDTIGVWAISVKFCADRGMRIAAIASKAQLLLLATYNALKFTADHWIAARESHKSRQFTWDGLTSHPNQTYGVRTNEHKINYQTCACINPDPSYRTL